MTKTYSKETIDTMYLDWFNNFLTLERFAEYYGIRDNTAKLIIKIGRLQNEVLTNETL